jgi:hypothetical protein
LTKGIDLETSTLGDQIEKQKFHLEGLESENHTEEAREGVATEEEEDPREEPHLPLRPPVTGEEDLEREPQVGLVRRERIQRKERETIVQGFKYPWTQRTGHCPVAPDFVQYGRTLSGRSG